MSDHPLYDGTNFLGVADERIGDGQTFQSTEVLDTGLDNRINGNLRHVIDRQGDAIGRTFVQPPEAPEGGKQKRLSTVDDPSYRDTWLHWPIELTGLDERFRFQCFGVIGGPDSSTLGQMKMRMELVVPGLERPVRKDVSWTASQQEPEGIDDAEVYDIILDVPAFDPAEAGLGVLKVQLYSSDELPHLATRTEIQDIYGHDEHAVDLNNLAGGGNSSSFERHEYLQGFSGSVQSEVYEVLAQVTTNAGARFALVQPPSMPRNTSLEFGFYSPSYLEPYAWHVSRQFDPDRTGTQYTPVEPAEIRAETNVDGPDTTHLIDNQDAIWSRGRWIAGGPFSERTYQRQETGDAHEHWSYIPFASTATPPETEFPYHPNTPPPWEVDRQTARIRAGSTIVCRGLMSIPRHKSGRLIGGGTTDPSEQSPPFPDGPEGSDIEDTALSASVDLRLEVEQWRNGSFVELVQSDVSWPAVPSYFIGANGAYRGAGQLLGLYPFGYNNNPEVPSGEHAVSRDGQFAADSGLFLYPFEISATVPDPGIDRSGTDQWPDVPVTIILSLADTIDPVGEWDGPGTGGIDFVLLQTLYYERSPTQ